MCTPIKLDQIITWEEYYMQNHSSIPTCKRPMFPVNSEINKKVSLWQGDIVNLQIDAIVNAANRNLRKGWGVCAAIFDAAGPELSKTCSLFKGTEPGTAKITSGFKLPAQYVIHAVGPTDKSPTVLRSAYQSSLRFIQTHQIRSIAFPPIAVGIFEFPLREATEIAVTCVRRFLDDNCNVAIDRVIFVPFDLGFDDEVRKTYEEVMTQCFPVGCSTVSKGPSTSPMLTTTRKRKSSTSSRVLVAKSTKPEKAYFTMDFILNISRLLHHSNV